jgi:hypothetical protein
MPCLQLRVPRHGMTPNYMHVLIPNLCFPGDPVQPCANYFCLANGVEQDVNAAAVLCDSDVAGDCKTKCCIELVPPGPPISCRNYDCRYTPLSLAITMHHPFRKCSVGTA